MIRDTIEKIKNGGPHLMDELSSLLQTVIIESRRAGLPVIYYLSEAEAKAVSSSAFVWEELLCFIVFVVDDALMQQANLSSERFMIMVENSINKSLKRIMELG